MPSQTITLIKLIAAMRADIGIRRKILAAVRAGEDKLGAAMRAHGRIRLEWATAIRAQIDAARGTFFVVLTDRLTTFSAEGSSFDLRSVHRLESPQSHLFFFQIIFQIGSTMGTHAGVGGNFLITNGAVESKLGPTQRAYIIVGIHLGPTLWANRVVFQFPLFEFNTLFGHTLILRSGFWHRHSGWPRAPLLKGARIFLRGG